MDDQVTPALAQSSAVRAFEDLRGEVSLLRRAIEGLAAERRDQPDYTPTLTQIVDEQRAFRGWAEKVTKLPALKLTPAVLASEIEEASSKLGLAEAEALKQARVDLGKAADILTRSLHGFLKYEQVRTLMLVSNVVMLLLGWIVGTIFP